MGHVRYNHTCWGKGKAITYLSDLKLVGPTYRWLQWRTWVMFSKKNWQHSGTCSPALLLPAVSSRAPCDRRKPWDVRNLFKSHQNYCFRSPEFGKKKGLFSCLSTVFFCPNLSHFGLVKIWHVSDKNWRILMQQICQILHTGDYYLTGQQKPKKH